MAYFSYPPTASSGGVPIYPNIGSFPPGTVMGQLGVAADTGILYEWNGSAWVPIASPGAALSVGTFDSGTPSPNGAHIDSNALIMQSASVSNPGEVNTGTQTFAGNKTFNGMITAANLSGQNTGDNAVVFRPGGVAGGVVYTTWTSLYAAIVGLDLAHVYICFDNSIAPCNIPAGTYSLPNVFFEAALGTSLTSPITVTLEDGCIFSAFPGVSSLITLTSVSSTPIFTVTDNYLIGLQFAGNLVSVSGAPMIQVPAGLTLFLLLLSDSAISGQPTFPLIELVGNATLLVLLAEGTTLGDNTISGGASAVLEVIVENPNVNLSTTQTDFSGTTGVSYPALASNITFGSNLGDLVYANPTGQGATLAADTSNTKKFLSEQSLLGNSQAPQWSTIGSTDLPGLTGDVTAAPGSNVTTVAKIQGTTVSGTTGTVNVVFSNTPTLVTPVLGAATGTSINLSGSATASQLISTVATGTAPLVVTSTTQVANLNVALAGNVTGTVAIGNGGTGQTTAANAFKALSPLTTAGDIIFENATPTPARLPIGSTGNVLTVSGGLPAWAPPATSGTVTSVALSVPATSIFGVTGSPVTSSGTLGLTTTGTSGGIPYFSSTSQLASSALLTVSQLIVGGGAGAAPATLAAGTANQYLKMNATPIPAWFTILAPTVQKFTSGSGTYTAPAGVVWLLVEMIGGGGGGAGGFNSSGGAGQFGGAGGNTTFGSSFLVANGGSGGTFAIVTGGTASIAAGAVGTATQGGSGGGTFNNNSVAASSAPGGNGASTAFAGGGTSTNGAAGSAGIANTGAGGGGGSYSAAATGADSGGGGAAGGYVKAIVNPVSATYAYAVGGSGTAGPAGTGGFAGGAGGSGYIIVTEHYV